MIYIQKPIWSIMPSFVHFGFIRSTLVHIGPSRSILVHFRPIQTIRSSLVLFDPFYPHWFYLVYVGHIQSTSVPFSLICSYSVHYVYFGPNQSIHSYSVPFDPIWSTSVLFGPFWSNFFLFSLILSIQSTLFHLLQFVSFWSIFVE